MIPAVVIPPISMALSLIRLLDLMVISGKAAVRGSGSGLNSKIRSIRGEMMLRREQLLTSSVNKMSGMLR